MDFKEEFWFNMGSVFLTSWNTCGLLGLYVVTDKGGYRQRRLFSVACFLTLLNSSVVWVGALFTPQSIISAGYCFLNRICLRSWRRRFLMSWSSTITYPSSQVVWYVIFYVSWMAGCIWEVLEWIHWFIINISCSVSIVRGRGWCLCTSSSRQRRLILFFQILSLVNNWGNR